VAGARSKPEQSTASGHVRIGLASPTSTLASTVIFLSFLEAIATLSSPEAADQKARLHRLERPSSVRQQESGATFRVSSMAHSGDLPERLYFVNGHTFFPPLISGSRIAQSSLYIFLTIFSWKYRPNSQIRAWLSESSPEFLPQVDSESATLVFRL
jgi:hypothetical protein